MVQIADAEWCGSFVRDAALRGVLRHIYSAICLLYGSIQTLLTQQARSLTSDRHEPSSAHLDEPKCEQPKFVSFVVSWVCIDMAGHQGDNAKPE